MAQSTPQSFTRFGSLLRYLRQRARLTQDELGLAVGYSRAHVARLESGQRAPDPGVVRARFAEALGLRDAPEVAARLYDLADVAHGSAYGGECAAPPATEATAPRIPHNLPSRATNFIGRERELNDLQRLLAATRLLTLTGAGGTGKTRLAIELAARLVGAEESAGCARAILPDGVWWVDLAPVSDPAFIPRAAAAVLGVREEPGQPLLAALLAWLRDKRLLLILDNCEHLLDACAQFADAVLCAGEGLRLLATSRERLGVPGELTWRVPSLSTPGMDEALLPEKLAGYEAVRLFVDRAQFVRPGFTLTPTDGPAVQQIVTRLDGIPLALELAAARLSALTPTDIATHLDDCFRLLTAGNRAALPRHRTLRACVDWSYGLLAEPERALLRRLAVFAGGWTLEAAEQICADEGAGMTEAHPASFVLESSHVLDALMRLVDQSLVVVDESGVETRYHLLETIRQYALEKLAQTDEEACARERHLDYYFRIGQHVAQSFDECTPADQVYLAKQAAAELDNARRALEWVAESGRFEEACKMAGAWAISFILCDVQGEWLARAHNLLARGAGGVDFPAQAAVLIRVADVHIRQGEFDQANAALDQA